MVEALGMEQSRVIIVTTGGTIEKSYSEFDGSLRNRQSQLKKRLLSRLRLPHREVVLKEAMAKDSLDMTDEDRAKILDLVVTQCLPMKSPVLILHGTDTMEVTARYFFDKLPQPEVPIIFTGAMKPVGYEDSDALQNFTEAMMASHLVLPAIYISFHNQLFKVPKVKKNRKLRTFVSMD